MSPSATPSQDNPLFLRDPDMADVVEAAAQQPANDRVELSGIVTDLITAFVRLIVSVISRPLNAVVSTVVAERIERERELMTMKLRDELRLEIEASIRAEYKARLADLESQIDQKVSAVVADTVRRQRNSIITEIQAGIQIQAPAASTTPSAGSITAVLSPRPAPEVRYVRYDPTYPFTLLAAFLGAIVGGFGSWWLTRNFEQATVIDEAGQNWIATSIAADPTYAVVFIVVSTLLVAAVCAVFGWIADAIRNR